MKVVVVLLLSGFLVFGETTLVGITKISGISIAVLETEKGQFLVETNEQVCGMTLVNISDRSAVFSDHGNLKELRLHSANPIIVKQTISAPPPISPSFIMTPELAAKYQIPLDDAPGAD